MGSLVDMHACNDIHTYSNQGLGLEEGNWYLHKSVQRGAHVFVQLCKGVVADMQSQGTCIHIPMHVHILINVWD